MQQVQYVLYRFSNHALSHTLMLVFCIYTKIADIRLRPCAFVFDVDVECFVKKKHRIGRHWFQVEIDHPVSPSTLSSLPILADTIQVTGDLPDIELLNVYFEGVKSGGGEEKEVESIKTVKEGVVHVKFSTKEGEK